MLTPWEVIAGRLDAAGRGDFVLAIYNPISQRRTWQLPEAKAILLRHRATETPVGLVDRAYRPGTRIWQRTLGDLTTDGISMETVLIVGNSQTRRVNQWMVTPRGYSTTHVPTRQGRGPDRPKTGGEIMEESFAIIERELGQVALPAWAFAVVRRMIHATADFEFARLLRFSDDFEPAIRRALASDAPVVTDTEMVLVGIRTALAEKPDVHLACYLNDAETPALAESAGLTRSAAGMRIAAKKHPSPILVIGNAPTALEESLRLIEQEDWRPAAIIGMPVGFVGVEEAKGRLLSQSRVPYLSCEGRKGGSPVAAAAFNALVLDGTPRTQPSP